MVWYNEIGVFLAKGGFMVWYNEIGVFLDNVVNTLLQQPCTVNSF